MRCMRRTWADCPVMSSQNIGWLERRLPIVPGVVAISAAALARCAKSCHGCYLVDPASSHMLVSKIKPCMCKYELIQTVKLRMAH